jgi:hypothetical protein
MDIWSTVILAFWKYGKPESQKARETDVWQAIGPENQRTRNMVNQFAVLPDSWFAGLPFYLKDGKMACWISIFRAHSSLFASQIENGLPCKWVISKKCAQYGIFPYLPVPVQYRGQANSVFMIPVREMRGQVREITVLLPKLQEGAVHVQHLHHLCLWS